MKSESREKKYQILINFSKLKELQADFLLKLTEENLYYDENGLLYLKDRDIYGRGEKPDDTYFLNAYKSFVAGVLGSKYSVKQIQESGIEICKEEKWFEPIYNCQTVEEIADVLRNVKKGLCYRAVTTDAESKEVYLFFMENRSNYYFDWYTNRWWLCGIFIFENSSKTKTIIGGK